LRSSFASHQKRKLMPTPSPSRREKRRNRAG
jgi:hypothetical protein